MTKAEIEAADELLEIYVQQRIQKALDSLGDL